MNKGNGGSRRIGGLSALITEGVRANGSRLFRLELDGWAWYDLLRFLESGAEAGGPYLQLRQAVLFSECIRSQLQTQGFSKSEGGCADGKE